MNEAVDEYISKTEMAKRMDVSTRTIETWMRERKVPFEKIGRTVRFHWGDVRNYLSRQSRVAAQPRDHLRPTEGTSTRLQELAASIRQRQRLNEHMATTNLGNADDKSTPSVVRAEPVQPDNARQGEAAG
jgi:excisionase family DNA binding protein